MSNDKTLTVILKGCYRGFERLSEAGMPWKRLRRWAVGISPVVVVAAAFVAILHDGTGLVRDWIRPKDQVAVRVGIGKRPEPTASIPVIRGQSPGKYQSAPEALKVRAQQKDLASRPKRRPSVSMPVRTQPDANERPETIRRVVGTVELNRRECKRIACLDGFHRGESLEIAERSGSAPRPAQALGEGVTRTQSGVIIFWNPDPNENLAELPGAQR